MTARKRLVGVAIAAALVAGAVPVLASGAGPATAANTTAVVSRSVELVCPAGATGHGSAFRIERPQRTHRHRVVVLGCGCPIGTGATGQTGSSTSTVCDPCPAVAGASTGSKTVTPLFVRHPILHRLRRIVRHAVCNPCPSSGASSSTGTVTPAGPEFRCAPCPTAGAIGTGGATPAAVLPRLRCHRPPCSLRAGETASHPARAEFACGPCPWPMTGVTRIFRRGAAASILCNPCPAAGSAGSSSSSGSSGTTGTIPGCICAFVRERWAGATGATGTVSCAPPPPCPQPLAVAGRAATWACCEQTHATGTTPSQCSPPPPVCEIWGTAGATGGTGATTDGHPCPLPPQPCTSMSAAGQAATSCGPAPVPCEPPQRTGAPANGAYVCPMIAPASAASTSA